MQTPEDHEITVDEAAVTLAVSPATVRRYCRQGKLHARKVHTEATQDGWAITASSVQSFKRLLAARMDNSKLAAVSNHAHLSVIDSALEKFTSAIRTELAEHKRALMPSQRELQDRESRDNQIEQALDLQAQRMEQFAQALGQLEAQRDRLREENERLRAELAQIGDLHHQLIARDHYDSLLASWQALSWWQRRKTPRPQPSDIIRGERPNS